MIHNHKLHGAVDFVGFSPHFELNIQFNSRIVANAVCEMNVAWESQSILRQKKTCAQLISISFSKKKTTYKDVSANDWGGLQKFYYSLFWIITTRERRERIHD